MIDKKNISGKLRNQVFFFIYFLFFQSSDFLSSVTVIPALETVRKVHFSQYNDLDKISIFIYNNGLWIPACAGMIENKSFRINSKSGIHNSFNNKYLISMLKFNLSFHKENDIIHTKKKKII